MVLFRVQKERMENQDQKAMLENLESLDTLGNLDTLVQRDLMDPKDSLAVKRIALTVTNTMLMMEMMVNQVTLVTKASLERKDQLDHLVMMPSATMEKMANQVIMESLEKMERRESLVLLALKESKEFTRPSSMAGASSSCSTWLESSKRDYTSAAMDIIITKGMLSWMKMLILTQKLTPT